MGVLERIRSAVAGAIPVEDDLDMENSQRVKNMPDPVSPQDAETSSNAQSKADAAQSDAESYADTQVSNHNSNTAVHGVGEVFDSADYSPEADTHSRYTDGEAAGAAPVQSVNGQSGDVQITSIPSGVITMWSGTAADVPDGWLLCDGTDGTPDLRGRFVVGAGAEYDAGVTGGVESANLSESELPAHDHPATNLSVDNHSHGSGSLSTGTSGNHAHTVANGASGIGDSFPNYFASTSPGTQKDSVDYGNSIGSTSPAVQSNGAHSHGVGGSTGGSGAGVSGSTGGAGSGDGHENRPPYYALAYIMKQ